MVAKSAPASSTKSASTTTGAGVSGANKRFKGVRMRSWGKWVSEIRLPNTRARLWLGSYATAEQAALAFDVAMVCLRGRSAALNFPDSPPSYAPLGLPHHQIQELAASAAAAAASSPFSATSSSPVPAVDSRANSASQLDSPISAASDESEADTTGYVPSWDQSSWLSATSAVSEAATTAQCSSLTSTSAGSHESEAATTNEMNSSSCSSPLSTAHTLEDLLLLDEDDEQSSSLTSSPFAALQEEQALQNMGREWEEELLWGCSLSSYSPWDQHLLLFSPLPADDDLTAIVDSCLWSL